jgi:phosphatidylglycerol lysyltransferase
MKQWKKWVFKGLGALASLIVFLAAVSVLRHELAAYSLVEIVRNLSGFPVKKILLSAGLVFTGISALIGYDFLALRYLRRPLSRLKTIMTSFTAFAMSNNLGFSFLASNSMRYRLYSGWGLSALEIAKIAVFCAVSSALGFLALAGSVLLINPGLVAGLASIPLTFIQPLGLLLILLPLVYLLISARRKQPFKIFKWEFSLPSIKLSAGQFILSLLNWSIAAAALFSLLPAVSGLTYFVFLGMYIISLEAGLMSQVPGGLGVFDSAMILFLSPLMPVSTIFQALLIYRVIYNLLPLSIGIATIGGQEIFRRKDQIQWAGRLIGGQFAGAFNFVADRWATADLPLPSFALRALSSGQTFFQNGLTKRRYAYSLAVIVFGTFLLFLGAIPTLAGPLAWLHGILPLPLLDISHFLMGVVGIGAILLLFRLQKRFDAAYMIALVLLATAVAFSLISGQYFGRAIALSIMLGIILPSRRHFHREISFRSRNFNGGLALAILILFACTFF